MSLVQIQMLIENIVVWNQFTCAACRLVITWSYLFYPDTHKLAKSTKWTDAFLKDVTLLWELSNDVVTKTSITVQSNIHLAALDMDVTISL